MILLEGKYGFATFTSPRVQNFTAWAYGPGGVGAKLSFTPDGRYKGKSVLPKGAGWVIVPAADP